MSKQPITMLDRAYKVGIALFVLCFFAASSQLLEGVASASMWSGRAPRYGYFDNNPGGSNSPYTCTGHRADGPVIDNNCYAKDAIPPSVNTPMRAYSFLYNKYTNPGTYGNVTWDQVGVSFIVNTMLGRSPNQSSATVTAADWADLKARLSSPDITTKKQIVNTNSYGSIDSYFQYLNNDVAYFSDPNFSDTALVFTQAGKVVYALYYSCANPIGDLGGFRQVNQWGVSTTSTANVSQVLPGQTITWTHTIKNNGPDATDQDVTYETQYGGNLGAGTANPHTFASGVANGATAQYTSKYKAKNSDLGKLVCEATSASPTAWDDSGTVTSAQACVLVYYSYGLTPSATFNGGGTATQREPGAGPINVNFSVANSGPTPSGITAWSVTRCQYGPSVTPPSTPTTTDNNLTATATFGSGGTCSPGPSGSGIFPPTTLPSVSETATNVAAGTHICYILTVSPPSSSIGGNRHSIVACISFVKLPKLQILGADMRADKVTTTGATQLGGTYYGSWGEFGIFGVTGVNGIGSGASFAQGAAATGANFDNALTFSNTSPIGQFAPSPVANVYYNAYKNDPAAVTVGGVNAGEAVGTGVHEVRFVNGNLSITGNITYPPSYATVNDIPRIIYVVNGSITVAEGVTQIDAWLISNNTLYTCDRYKNPAVDTLTTTQCDNQLTFNGPVIAQDTVLGRTAGSEIVDPGKPAEIFNLSPSNYLSTYNQSISSSDIQTVYEKELPPRW